MKQKKSICCLSAKGTNPCFVGGSISSLLVSATGTNKITELNKFTKNDDQHLSFPEQLNQARFHATFSQDAFSGEKRINVGIFLQVQEEEILQGLQYTQKNRMGHWRQARVTVQARFQKHGGLAAAVLQRQCSQGLLSVLKSTRNKETTYAIFNC